MKRRSLPVIVFLSFLCMAASAQNKCATDIYHKLQREKFRIQNRQNENVKMLGLSSVSGIITIPIVVHVIHNRADGILGGANNANISDEQIKSQIDVLNEDYRKVLGTNGYNDNPVGADIEIEFQLATTSPDCQPTNGITRHYDSRSSFEPITDDVLIKSHGYWPNDEYLNIWVCSLSGNYLGYTQFPNYSGLPGLDAYNGSSTTDGIVVHHKVFGRKTGTVTYSKYNYGRTATHEIGHWLGLIHTWGDDFCGNDYCDDTPTCESSNLSSYCTPVYSNCNGVTTKNMIENYLDYSPDLCMNIFTQDQKARMRSVLASSPDRIKILNSKGTKSIIDYPVSLTLDFEAQNYTLDKNWTIEGNDTHWQTTYKAGIGANGTSNGVLIFKKDDTEDTASVSLVSPTIVTQSFQYLGVTFDSYYANVEVTDSLIVAVLSGCDTQKELFVKPYTGKNLITSTSVSSEPEAGYWRRNYVVVPVPSDKPSLRVGFKNYIKGSQPLYIDNINIFSMQDNLRVGAYSNPYRLAATANFNDKDGNISLEAIFDGTSDVYIEIYDITGKKTISQSYLAVTSGTFYINTFSFSAGVYLVKTSVGSEMRINKIVVY